MPEPYLKCSQMITDRKTLRGDHRVNSGSTLKVDLTLSLGNSWDRGSFMLQTVVHSHNYSSSDFFINLFFKSIGRHRDLKNLMQTHDTDSVQPFIVCSSVRRFCRSSPTTKATSCLCESNKCRYLLHKHVEQDGNSFSNKTFCCERKKGWRERSRGSSIRVSLKHVHVLYVWSQPPGRGSSCDFIHFGFPLLFNLWLLRMLKLHYLVPNHTPRPQQYHNIFCC